MPVASGMLVRTRRAPPPLRRALPRRALLPAGRDSSPPARRDCPRSRRASIQCARALPRITHALGQLDDGSARPQVSRCCARRRFVSRHRPAAVTQPIETDLRRTRQTSGLLLARRSRRAVDPDAHRRFALCTAPPRGAPTDRRSSAAGSDRPSAAPAPNIAPRRRCHRASRGCSPVRSARASLPTEPSAT